MEGNHGENGFGAEDAYARVGEAMLPPIVDKLASPAAWC
jgi:hypothetical protein